MEPIERVHHQLERCAGDFNKMVAADDIVLIEDLWHDFLTHIDRFWNLADRYFARFDGWREFRQPIRLLRVKKPVRKRKRGYDYEIVEPPTMHQGAPIEPNAFVVARKGFEYYKEFFRVACERYLEPIRK